MSAAWLGEPDLDAEVEAGPRHGAGAARPAAAGRADAGERGALAASTSLSHARDRRRVPPPPSRASQTAMPATAPPPALSFAGRAASAGIGAPPRGRRRVIRCRRLGIQERAVGPRARAKPTRCSPAATTSDTTVAQRRPASKPRASGAIAPGRRPPPRGRGRVFRRRGLGIQSEPPARARARET